MVVDKYFILISLFLSTGIDVEIGVKKLAALLLATSIYPNCTELFPVVKFATIKLPFTFTQNTMFCDKPLIIDDFAKSESNSKTFATVLPAPVADIFTISPELRCHIPALYNCVFFT